ncbi:MAG: hypothetical protein LBT59_25790 [Clostridiales bacterium]|nr:hypothetical protein [Clostridiales bacterium]
MKGGILLNLKGRKYLFGMLVLIYIGIYFAEMTTATQKQEIFDRLEILDTIDEDDLTLMDRSMQVLRLFHKER